MNKDKDEYIDKLTDWLVCAKHLHTDDLIADAKAGTSLSGVYAGGSARIWRLVRLAYLRGVRRGASITWDAKQPITLRKSPE